MRSAAVAWRITYNTRRPQRRLGYLTPEAFARHYRETSQTAKPQFQAA